ncbi:MAG TPA: hypothetical protein VF797_23250 [Noviherbaspirillum sp.]
MNKYTSTGCTWRKRVEKKICAAINRLMLAKNDVEKAKARVWIGLWNELLWGKGSSASLGKTGQNIGIDQL